MTLEYTQFVRKPFMVEAIEVTPENIRELAKIVGQIKFDENTGAPYILVDRKKVPNVYRVTPGYWVTRVDNKIRAYSHNSFDAQFTASSEQIEEWVNFMNGSNQSVDEESDEEVENESDKDAAKEQVG